MQQHQRGWQQEECAGKGHVENGIDWVQRRVQGTAEHIAEDQVHCASGVGQSAHEHTQQKILRLASLVRALALSKSRHCSKNDACYHQKHFRPSHFLGQVRNARTQKLLENQGDDGQARPNDHVQRNRKQRQTEVVQADVHREGKGEENHTSHLRPALQASRCVAVGCAVQGCDDAKEHDKSHHLLHRSYQKAGRDSVDS
mmetsp:Transcript_39097/g.72861  ORF Transcript_39097/g.72861 Transcript_39097/m.72861 type:complete len:200 (-) Transcript_39097:660-1259(-)